MLNLKDVNSVKPTIPMKTVCGNNNIVQINSSKSVAIGIASLDTPGKKLLAKFVNQMVATAFELTAERLLKSDRGIAKTTRARQIAVYLMHTCLSFSLTEIARVYGKDRTTIGHACRVVEDLRDTPAFDDRMIELEETIHTVLVLAKNNASREVSSVR